jgi:hypothetical protein
MATAMVAYGRIIEISAPVIAKLSGISDPFVVRVFLKEIRAGSADEGFINRFVFKNQKSKDAFIDWLRRVTLVEHLQEKNPTLGKLWAYILVGGAMFAVGRYGLPNPKSTVHIQDVSSAIINVGGTINIPHESIQEAMSAGIRNKAVLATNAVKVIRPAKHDEHALIRVDNRDELTIPPEAIREVPSIIGEAEEIQQTKTLTAVQISVRALDRDSTQKGWAAVVPSFSERRAKLELDPSVDSSVVARSEILCGDIEASYRLDQRGNEVPRRYTLLRIR